jgi:hypothetical protein
VFFLGNGLRVFLIFLGDWKILRVRSKGVVKMENQDYEKIFEEYQKQGEQQSAMEESHREPDNREQFVAVRKREDGDIIAFKTSTGRELDYVTALGEAKAGKIAHVDVFHKYGRDIIRSEPDGLKENNLDQLPEF